ncbi:MAG: hypothetical protein JNM98_18720 [Rhodocyclaceae bacterium]|nr:hypothetical protein [Rhodocyclaceae bacterium]
METINGLRQPFLYAVVGTAIARQYLSMDAPGHIPAGAHASTDDGHGYAVLIPRESASAMN